MWEKILSVLRGFISILKGHDETDSDVRKNFSAISDNYKDLVDRLQVKLEEAEKKIERLLDNEREMLEEISEIKLAQLECEMERKADQARIQGLEAKVAKLQEEIDD